MKALRHLRTYLVDEGLVRAPDQIGAGARPWLPPAWRHPENGPVGPGDKKDEGAPDNQHDDGMVVSLMHAPGIPPDAGGEERRHLGVDIVFRSRDVVSIDNLDGEIRGRLLGDDPGGRADWVMGGLYVIQSKVWSELQPRDSEDEVFTFAAGWIFEVRR